MKIYVINLDKDIERYSAIKDSLNALNCEHVRLTAVDGRVLPENEYIEFCTQSPRDGRGWLRGQVGCFKSHFNAWEIIAEGHDDYAIILEDDISISIDFTKIIENAQWIPNGTDIIRLEAPTNRVLLDRKDSFGINGEYCYRLKSTAWCTGGYIISRKAAQQLVNAPASAYQPSDFYMFSKEYSPFFRSMKIYQFSPAFCLQNKFSSNVIFKSNIEVGGKTNKVKVGELTVIFEKIKNTLLGFKRVPSKLK